MDEIVRRLSAVARFIRKPKLKDLELSEHLWLKLDQEYYFALYGGQVRGKYVVLDFDCIDRSFVETLIDNPSGTLTAFSDLFSNLTIVAAWVVDPPDLTLDEFYEKLVSDADPLGLYIKNKDTN